MFNINPKTTIVRLAKEGFGVFSLLLFLADGIIPVLTEAQWLPLDRPIQVTSAFVLITFLLTNLVESSLLRQTPFSFWLLYVSVTLTLQYPSLNLLPSQHLS